MAQIFTPIHNMFAKASLIVLIVLVNVFFIVNDAIHRSPYRRASHAGGAVQPPASREHGHRLSVLPHLSGAE